VTKIPTLKIIKDIYSLNCEEFKEELNIANIA
jgi:hypothetical protein